MKAAASQGATRRPNLKHGVHTLKKAVAVLGSRALPTKRTALGRELAAWRASLVADLGGEPTVSTMQLALVEKAVTQKLICDSLDGYVLGMASLVNKRHRTLWPVVRERAAQVALLQSILRDLGLERRPHDIDVAATLAALSRGRESHTVPPPPPAPLSTQSETSETGEARSQPPAIAGCE